MVHKTAQRTNKVKIGHLGSCFKLTKNSQTYGLEVVLLGNWAQGMCLVEDEKMELQRG